MASASTQILDALLESKTITKEKYQEALNHFKKNKVSIIESLIEIRATDEEKLLKQLSLVFRTRYVSTEKLKQAEITADVLKKIPAKLAQKHNIFPILFDKKIGELSIVNANPNDINIEEEVRQAANVPRVRSFLARPAAIKAAISKFYRGDIHAFSSLDTEGQQAFHNMLDVYERQLLDEETMVVSLAAEGGRGERMISADALKQDGQKSDAQSGAMGSNINTSLEIMRVMVSLLESSRAELAGHSVQTAQHTERMCKRIGLTDTETASVTMAALLHDLGKGSPYHLTPFNVAEWGGHRTAAEKRFENPLRLFQSIALPEMTRLSVKHMYEQCNGTGFPDGMKAKDIPLGARILAMADTFADLTTNPRNPYRRMLDTEEAVQVLKKAKGTVLDGNLVDLFAMVVAGDDIKRQLLTGAQTILVVDSDAEQSAILDLQLTTRGFRVLTAKTAEMASKILTDSKASIVISEIDLETIDGFKFKEQLNSNKSTRNIPFIFFTSRSGSADVEKGFSLGAKDYLIKPLTVDVLVAKIKKYLAEAPADGGSGVSGSLKEMSLPDLVQILSHGRKSGRLKLTMGQHRGEIHFGDGEVYNALFDQHRGEEAFFHMLRHREGSFILDPAFKVDSRVINMTSEMLLLEGMRRLDEDAR